MPEQASLGTALDYLVIANQILATEGAIDAFWHAGDIGRVSRGRPVASALTTARIRGRFAWV